MDSECSSIDKKGRFALTQEDQATSAPKAVRVSIKTAV